jgi:citrate lyase subunit beta/citryl-CoA lyase
MKTSRPDRTAVSYLFVPGVQLDRIEKARLSAADEVIIDLEDSVRAVDKPVARQNLSKLPTGRSIQVRINPRGSPEHDADLRAVAAQPLVSAVVLPKVESEEDVTLVAAVLPEWVRLIALVETARGIVAAESVARAAVSGLMFGCVDYLTDIGVGLSREALVYPRSRLVLASRAADLPAPIDGPSLAIGDDVALRTESDEAKALGMGGKLCVHPNQVPIVNQVFHTSDEEHRWAAAVLAAAENRGEGGFMFEGLMVDEPVLARARRLLEQT